MRFVFSKLFYALLVLGFVPLSLSWRRPGLRAEAELDGATPDAVITDILQTAEVPR